MSYKLRKIDLMETDVDSAEELRVKVLSHLDNGLYKELKRLLDVERSSFELKEWVNIFKLVEIAGAYISLGSESLDKESVEIGLQIFSRYRDDFTGHVTESSIEYCIGNAYHALYKINLQNQEQWSINPETVQGNLFEAKQSYFKVYKLLNLNELDSFSIQVLTNLGNNLNHSGRIVEALQLFDIVLQHNPRFPQALLSKADTLAFMVSSTQCHRSMSLFAEMYRLFQGGLEQNPFLPPDVQKTIDINLERCVYSLNSLEFDFNSLEREFAINQEEYEQHSDERKFQIDNFLSLSEHGLYCKCNRAKIDDLFIGFPGLDVTDRRVAELEHLLNRIKSEFSFARKQLYDYRKTTTLDYAYYQDFGTHDLIYGVQIEKLRIAFRMCFGILDKIAQGILHLFGLEKRNNENTYFESFWRNPKAKDRDIRWEKFNEVKNTHLTALYSIACDLSKHNGEFHFYKKWRNSLEHDMFSLLPAQAKSKIFMKSEFLSEWTTEKDFHEKTLHLLQLVRAAIFSFTFSCREELFPDNNSNNPH